jgi:hypothetical protein
MVANFSKVPNFALEYGDIDIVQNEGSTHPCPLPSPTDNTRYIVQHFETEDFELMPPLAPHNMMARLRGRPNLPSSLVTDLWYGCCAFKKWGAHGLVEEELKRLAGEFYYDNDSDNDSNNNNGTQNQDRQTTPTQRDIGTSTARTVRPRKRARGEDSDAIDSHSPEMLSAMDVISALWGCAPRNVIEERREERREAEQREAEESTSRVLGWMETL